MISGFERITDCGYAPTSLQEPMKVPMRFTSEAHLQAPKTCSEKASESEGNLDLLQYRLENARLTYQNALLSYQMQQTWQAAHHPWMGAWAQRQQNMAMPTKGLGKKLEQVKSAAANLAHEDVSTSAGSSWPCSSAGSDAGDAMQTTKMMRNIPNDYTRQMLLDWVDSYGFSGKYNFVYLPIDFKSGANLGYAFINLVSQEDAEELQEALHGFSEWRVPSDKVCEVSWSVVVRGLDAHIERYRNSPVMHPDVKDEFRPLLFVDGKRVPFPKPTKKIRNPQIRPRR